MEKFRLNGTIKFTLFFILVVIAMSGIKTRWRPAMWESIAYADGRGYYAYLPAVFIYQDLNFGFFEASEEKCDNYGGAYSYLAYANDKRINKYFVGVAVMQTPFFLMAHAASHIFGEPTDGFDMLYFKFIHIGAWFYLILGLYFISRFLLKLNINPKAIALTLVVITFGTNLFHYAVHEAGMSHVPSFALFSIFIYLTHLYFESHRKWLVVLILAVLGLIILVRPINGIIIFSIPFIAGSWSSLKLGFIQIFRNYKQLILGILAMVAVISIQLIIYKISTGKFYNYSYGGEKMDFTKFNLLKFLFSYKKGLFLYTPVYLLSLFGYLAVVKHDKFRFYFGFGFTLFVLYIISSWWNWWYGGSFSSRPMVEFLPFFAFPLAFGLASIKARKQKIAAITIVLAFTALCVIQDTQYYYGVIHWDSMDKERYWESIRNIKYLF